LRVGVRFENQLHWYALHDLYVIASCILGRQQAEARTGRTADRVDVAVEFVAVCIHVALALLPHLHLLELCLFEIGGDPEIVEVDDGDQGLPGLHNLPGLNGALADDTREWCAHSGVLEIELRLFER